MDPTGLPTTSFRGYAEDFSDTRLPTTVTTLTSATENTNTQKEQITEIFQNTRLQWLATSTSRFYPISFRPQILKPIASDQDYDKSPVIIDLVSFLSNAPTSWHAVHEISQRLDTFHFTQLNENEEWNLTPGHRYYVIHNDSSIIAFVLPTATPTSAVILGAHTDSPGLQIKPNPDLKVENYRMLATQVYGGPILPSWFNRPLGLAGRYYCTNGDGKLEARFVNIAEPIGNIPHLAIHLQRDLGTKVDLNPQKELNAIVVTTSDLPNDKPFIEWIIENQFGSTPLPVPGYELFLRPMEAPILWGPHKHHLKPKT